MFKFNPHFEMYRIMVALGDDGVKEPFFNWWFFTKFGAEKALKRLPNSHKSEPDMWHFSVERVIRSDRVREKNSQKAKL